MKIKGSISVGNNATLGFNSVEVETTCQAFVELRVPQKDGTVMEIELRRTELREFLARTEPAFWSKEYYDSKATNPQPIACNNP